MAASLEMQVQRFIKAIKDGSDARKLHSILSTIPKGEFMAWKDNKGQDVLHYAILSNNAEAADFLLKMGYFNDTYEPQVNMYAHLAARLGFRAVLCTILQYRPEDFRVMQQPLKLPPDLGTSKRHSVSKPTTKEVEPAMPAVVGCQFFVGGKDSPDDACSSIPFPKSPTLSRSAFPLTSSASTRFNHVSLVDRFCLPRSDRTFSGGAQQFDSNDGKISSRNSPVCFGIMPKKREKPDYSKRRFSSPEESMQSHLSMDDSRPLKVKPLKCTPLDIAARYKHVDCVKILLDMYVSRVHPERGNKGYLTLAALANNISSLKLFLEPYLGGTNDHTVREDFRQAVHVCVQSIFPECLEVLLCAELVDTKQMFKNINYFHVMYSQPFDTYLKLLSLARLPVMTQNLINRGHDVKTKMPPRTYPLYTLLDNAFSYTDFTFSEYIITCMKLLMDNGADPNFDEVDFEKQLPSSLGCSRHFGGRIPYSSALHCLLQSVERFHPRRGPAIRFVEECVDALISHSADIEKMGYIDAESYQVRGDVLWQFAKSSVSMGMERGLLHCLTRFGAQPQRKINGQFALNVYLDTLCALMKSDSVNALDHLNKREKDVGQMINLMCFFMAPWHIKAVWDIFNYRHKKCTGEGHEQFKERVNEALAKQSKHIHTLRTITAWQVWKLCRRKADNIKKLPIAKDLKMHVLPLVLFQTFW